MKRQQEIAAPDDNKVVSRKETHKKNSKPVKLTATRKITYFAVLVAITFILKWLSNYLTFGPIKITLSYLGFFISAIIVGPIGGGAVAVIADVLSQFAGGIYGVPHPLIVIGNFGGTFLFGVIYHYLPAKTFVPKVFFGTLAFIVWATLGFNSVANYLYYYEGTNYLAYMFTTRTIQIPIALLNMVLTMLLIPQMRKIKLVA
jgi:ECF transporter S component (folate family)